MTPHEEFCNWLKGFGDIVQRPPTAFEWKRIRDELRKVTDEPTLTATSISNTGVTWYTPRISWDVDGKSASRPLIEGKADT